MSGEYVPNLFEEVKAKVGIKEAADWLGLKYKQGDDSLRCQCPINQGEKGEISITPSEGKFRCFGCRAGGDVIALVSHIKGIRQRDAALQLQDAFTEARKPAKTEPQQLQRGMKPLSHLKHDHASLSPLQEVAEAVGIGVTNKGLMQGRIAVPLRLPDGTLIGYLGIPTSTDIKVPDEWHT